MKKTDKNKTLILTFVDLGAHFVFTSILALFFFWSKKNLLWPILSVFGGIFIDLDHFIDYFLYFGPGFDLMSFLRHEYQKSGKCYVLFHSWEILCGLWILTFFIDWMVPLAAGMTGHMIIDSLISHRSNISALSLVCRWKHGFKILDKKRAV